VSDSPSRHDSASNGRQLPLPARVTVSVRAGAILALANIVCVLIFSWAWMHVKAEPKAISVTGSARKEIESDLIVWSAEISASDPQLQTAYANLKASLDKTVAYLTAQGIPATQMTIGSIAMQKHHARDAKGRETDVITSYELTQSVQITSDDVERISNVARTATDLIKDGVLLESDSPEFFYTKLADLKIEMLADATKDATNRAQQIAANSGARLGSILDARMGVMQINAIHSTDTSDSGVNDTTSRQKEITAVVSARFELD
jgi:uncharacterized protein